jgi:hypothetical protein
VCFQNDNNLVVYDGGGSALWASNTVTGNEQTLNINACAITMIDGPAAALCDQWNRHDVCQATEFGFLFCGPHDYPDNGLACHSAENLEMGWASCYCGNPASYTKTVISAPACMMPLPGGGFSYLKDMKGGSSDFGAELWVLAAATSASGLSTLQSMTALSPAHDAVTEDTKMQVESPSPDWMEVLGDAGVSATLF